jgi:TonB family protein
MLVIGAVFLTTFFQRSALAACDPPQYEKALIYEDSQSSTLMQISIRLSDFAPSKLVCLAEALKRSYPGRKKIGVSIFSSYDAAKHYRLVQGDFVGKRPNWGAEMHGDYFYDADKHVEYVEILPLGAHSPFATRIDLPSSRAPQCQLQIGDRCLLATGALQYPGDAVKSGNSGTVTLTGTIARDGKLTGVRVAVASLSLVKDGGLLESAAVQDLKSWRFEPTTHEEPVRITYTYEISPPDTGREKPTIEFDLPHRVIIRAKPY